MNEVWSSYRRKLVNIDKAIFNPEVSRLLQIHYKYLHSRLVLSKKDEGIFNDTYLKLTYKYDSSKDFIELFVYYFKLLKGAYYRDDKVANYYVGLGEAENKADTSIEFDTISENIPDKPVDKPKFSDFKTEILNYAISQKAYKRKKQNH